eukprot:scaffold88590_cov53-Attheya_sp.AAC.2
MVYILISVSLLFRSVTRSARDHDRNARRSFLYQIPVSTDGSKDALFVPPPTEVPSNVKARIPSPSGSKVALLVIEEIMTAAQAGGKSTKQVLEIWTQNGHCLSRRIELPKSVHGNVCTDMSWFGSISWNSQETAIVYSAERNAPNTASFFQSKSDQTKDETVVVVGGEFTLGVGKGEDWGEKYTSTSALGLFCVHVATGKVGAIQNVPGGSDYSKPTTEGGYTLGQAIFSPDGTKVIYTAWDAGGGGQMPKRLGSIYCYQRSSQLYSSPISNLIHSLSSTVDGEESSTSVTRKVDSAYICLTPKYKLARSPRFTPPSASNVRLVYLSCASGFDTHGGCMALSCMEWPIEGVINPISRIIVDTVETPKMDNDGKPRVASMAFPGLFVNQLPDGCFSPDGKYVFASTQWGSVNRIVRISMQDGDVMPLEIDSFAGKGASPLASQSLLCLTNDGGGTAIISQSEPNQPPIIGFASFGETCKSGLLFKMPPVAFSSTWGVEGPIMSGLSYDVLSMEPPHGSVKVPIQCILMMPNQTKDGSPPPLLVVPHGGPHSVSLTTFIPSYAFLCGYGGYAILHVNYRGSAGFGQAALESLAGTAGSLDVEDVVFATREVIDMGKVDGERIGICGGSHGGFLAAHCIGQYPKLFRVAAMRNPVTNIATMVTATDIPDWCYIEAMGKGSYNWETFRGPTQQELREMWNASPIAHVDNVVAPTLLALGMSDRRVPPSQGLEYYHSLRSKNISTKLLIYDKDDHAIDKVVSEADHWINIKRWFDEHFSY